jgi:hypothetical protein
MAMETTDVEGDAGNQATSQASGQVARFRRLVQEQSKEVIDFKMVF